MNPEELTSTAQASGLLSSVALKNLEEWLTNPAFAEFKPGVEGLLALGNWTAVEDAFYGHLTVGTGGIRGTLGIGPNRINRRTIGEAAQGLSRFIAELAPQGTKGVVIGYEVRKHSREFAELSAEIFAANGIPVFLFEHICSTPEVSFAVRHLKATAGVMITASHNPRTDNGFKFYWSDGGQVVPPYDEKFMDYVMDVSEIKRIPLSQVRANGLVTSTPASVDADYIAAVRSLSVSKSRSAKIVFSPIHGVGSTNVLPVLRQEGFDVTVVPEQAEPDENFPTAHGDLINPEFREVMELPIRLGEKLNADLVLNSDPDADRVGVAVKKELGEPELEFLNGDQVGALLTYFVLSDLAQKKKLDENGLVVTTYVTTSLIGDIARSFGVKVTEDLLVGFKYIGEIIKNLSDEKNFIFGAEQSLGYLAGTFVRDKDASIASLLIAEMTSELKDAGKTVTERLGEIHEQYGYYRNMLETIELRGALGKKQTEAIMRGLRAAPPQIIGDSEVLKIIDRFPTEKMQTYKVGQTGDQLTYVLSEDGRTRVTVRPSGTEPTVKCYIQHYAPASSDLNKAQVRIDSETESLAKTIRNLCLSYARASAS